MNIKLGQVRAFRIATQTLPLPRKKSRGLDPPPAGEAMQIRHQLVGMWADPSTPRLRLAVLWAAGARGGEGSDRDPSSPSSDAVASGPGDPTGIPPRVALRLDTQTPPPSLVQGGITMTSVHSE